MMEISKLILSQLGGSRFIAMTGSKNFIGSKNTLTMRLTRNKLNAKYLKISLNGMDTYDLEFSTTKNKIINDVIITDQLVVIKNIYGVYCDQLQEIFTKETGLYTRL